MRTEEQLHKTAPCQRRIVNQETNSLAPTDDIDKLTQLVLDMEAEMAAPRRLAAAPGFRCGAKDHCLSGMVVGAPV